MLKGKEGKDGVRLAWISDMSINTLLENAFPVPGIADVKQHIASKRWITVTNTIGKRL